MWRTARHSASGRPRRATELVLLAMAITCYRVVKTDPPTVHDFLSGATIGRIPAGTRPEIRRLLDGISVFATLAQARRKTRGVGYRMGVYIAELHLPDAAPVRYEKTGGPGHHTLWGQPDQLLSYVVHVVPARPAP